MFKKRSTYSFGMVKNIGVLVIFFCSMISGAQTQLPVPTYLDSLQTEMQLKWPNNRTINLVFHGHSVPTGYFTGGVVHTVVSYPYLTLRKVKELYPFAVLNVITTAIGGEQSEQGAKRFTKEVLPYRPDILFIDYALNDRSIGLARAKKAWIQMIKEAMAYGSKVFLLTPTPDTNENIMDSNTPLAQHSEQIRRLAKQYNLGLIDAYGMFKKLAMQEDLNSFMAQNNHINKKGHEIVANEIVSMLKPKESDNN